jgi:hypothetical protein
MNYDLDWCKAGSFFKLPNKYWELQISLFENNPDIFNFVLNWSRKCDHAGFEFRVEILPFYFSFKIYDNRHWDFENDNWS